MSFIVLAIALAVGATRAAPGPRWTVPLNGEWQLQTNGAPADRWNAVRVPRAFEADLGIGFDGVVWYRKAVKPPPLTAGQRLFLEFEAVATEAEVYWDGERLGSHVGGWTPFRFDVTRLVKRSRRKALAEIRVRVDEKVGHNTQGFLPIVQPHFGGIWQEARLRVVPDVYIDELSLLAVGNLETRSVEVAFPVVGSPGVEPGAVGVRYRRVGEEEWRMPERVAPWQPAGKSGDGPVCGLEVRLPGVLPWEPANPVLYELEIRLPGGDRVQVRTAFRRIEARGRRLLLNGRPLSVRGVLNWGYYPPLLAPRPDLATIRQDLEHVRSRGFNLMKFCLWFPPREFLELADEVGILTWMEYPTWHPQLTPEHRQDLEGEFREFFLRDRNHPSTILRSLTCETGPGADLEVIRSLYGMAHELVPGALVEDDSSWIEWNRVHDFYDDHPYGNNHTWPGTLRRLNEYIGARTAKPLVLGEAMAADTWVRTEAYRRLLGEAENVRISMPGLAASCTDPRLRRTNDAKPYWFPGASDAQRGWLERLREVDPQTDWETRLEEDSLRYAHLMRKYQIETFRRMVPAGGYVVSVIRDVPLASMGLIDYLGQDKWEPAAWGWHGDSMLLVRTEGDVHSFFGGGRFDARLWLTYFGHEPLEGSRLSWELRVEPENEVWGEGNAVPAPILPAALVELGRCRVSLPEVSAPKAVLLSVRLSASAMNLTNAWRFWVVPRPGTFNAVWRHASLSEELAKELLPGSRKGEKPPAQAVWVASRFDEPLIRWLEQGGRALVLPDGERGSFPLENHWFLRGAPIVPEHPVADGAGRALMVELQHFDLAGPVIPELSFWNETDPVLMLWDTHDLRTVKTHALIFETRVGAGRLLVTALNHNGARNAAGRWLLSRLVRHLETGSAPKRALSEHHWQRLKRKVREERITLVDRSWRFRPDPNERGLVEGWQAVETPAAEGWSEIKVGQHWEGQGHAAVDGWAWYRLRLEVPKEWRGRSVYLTFEGVDDLYELYVNGEQVARRGDLARRIDTFNERYSHDLTAHVTPGEPALIAVRVHDWYGAGGIFRPASLGTAPLDPEGEILR